MAGINKVIILGRIGKDPEVKYMPNGNAVANLSLATSEKWKDKNTGQQQEKTEWHNVVVFGKLAEVVGQYLSKGAQVYFEGKLQTRKWQDQSGADRYTTEIIVDINGKMEMLGGQPSGNSGQFSQAQGQGGYQQQAPQKNQGYGNQQQTQSNQYPQQAPQMPDNDVPFAPIGLQHKALLNCI